MKLKVIFPSNPLDYRQVDPDFLSESEAVKTLGGEVVLFDFDRFRKSVSDLGDPSDMLFHWLNLQNQDVCDAPWIYRGWMMTPGEYESFHDILLNFRMRLLNSPTQYAMCHLYPLVYPYIKSHAIDTYVIDKPDFELCDYVNLKNRFGNCGRLFVKDWVKSAKDVDGASVIEDIEDIDHVFSVLNKLRDARGRFFYEGFVFKRFEKFKMRSDGKPEEFRAFFINDELISIKPTHGPGGMDIGVPAWLPPLAKKVPSDFYTIDLGVMDDGDVRIIETGDGGVSGLSPGQLPITFYSSILASSIK